MTTRVLTLSNQGSARAKRRSDTTHNHQETAVRESFNSAGTTDGRDGLYSFLHEELRISSEVAEFYCTSLTDNGYDDVASLQDATEIDLKELGVKIGHVRRIKRAVFSNCLRRERRSSCGRRRVSEMHFAFSNEVVDEGVHDSTRQPIEGSLLSDYARQEITNYTPSSRGEQSYDVDLADSQELLIRKQAEKIASLEAKLAYVDLNDDARMSASRGGSADTQSKKLTPEERLRLHKERKLQENKYKEKSGKWEAPPTTKKEKSITAKVAENDELVLKLTSDRSYRRKIDEVESSAKKGTRRVMQRDDGTSARSPRLGVSNKMNTDGGYKQQSQHSSSTSLSSGERCHSIKEDAFQRNRIPFKASCDTCGSTKGCEEDVDNPGIFYCKFCWDEYESAVVMPENAQKPQDQVKVATHDPVLSDVHHALWVAHDNPQLGDKLVCSGPRRMECMLETKEPGKKDCVRIIIGDIDFSGKVQNSGIGNIQGSEDNDQGSECIRIRNAKGFYIDHNQVASRLSRDKSIYEFHLGDESALLLTGKSASMSVGEFFKDCHGAIDVILDPQRDAGGWYPQKEARSGGRKIAPQFRSRGVGYIRLGDDMSENGLAFLSVKACSTFLSSVGSAKKSPPSYSKSVLATTKPSSKKANEKSVALSTRAASKRQSASFRRSPPPNDPSDDSDNDDSEDETPNVAEVLKQLQTADTTNMKWKDKAELLSQLGKGASRQDGQHVRSSALNVIQDTLGAKNVNVHVIRSALIAAGMIGISMGGELVLQNSWKTIMIETFKLLKSKQCGMVAKTVLAQLHGPCYTLANSLEYISHVLGLGMAASASKNKNSRMSNVMETPKPRRTTPSGGDSVEVVEWLAQTTERERNIDVVDPMLDKSSLNSLMNLFLSHADHRDQRCRKNVLDGLMHCVLYGVKHLGIEMTRVMRMCSGLKETNPKAWNLIYQSVQAVLEDEMS